MPMKYPAIEINNHYKTVECPVCKNEETDTVGSYCQICGTMIVNMCSSDHVYQSDYCVGVEGLEGNARYCPYCGAPSTFLKNGILLPWDANVPKQPKVYTLQEMMDGDNDLPF